MKNFMIAIDGPAGSGKSSISKIIAGKLKFNHLDTGAMYRAITLEALNRNVNLNDESKFDFIDELDIDYHDDKMFLNSRDVSKEIRSEEVTKHVSLVSSYAIVREKMVMLQRKIAGKGKYILDGRDVGYNVLPNANLKIFLTASVEERTKRRCFENKKLGFESDLEKIKEEIIKRDYQDSNRKIAPLKKAEDAILLDTTDLSIEEVCSIIINLINERI